MSRKHAEQKELTIEEQLEQEAALRPPLKLKNDGEIDQKQLIEASTETLKTVLQDALKSTDPESQLLTESLLDSYKYYQARQKAVGQEWKYLIGTDVAYGLEALWAVRLLGALNYLNGDIPSWIVVEGAMWVVTIVITFFRYAAQSDQGTSGTHHLEVSYDHRERAEKELRKRLLLFVEPEEWLNIVKELPLEPIFEVFDAYIADQEAQQKAAAEKKEEADLVAQKEASRLAAEQKATQKRESELFEVDQLRKNILNKVQRD